MKFFFFSSRRRHTRCSRDWSSDVCSSDLKSRNYRSRMVREPRAVLAEFGLKIPRQTRIRVHDSTADMRYLVLPMRPAGTRGWSEERLAALVTRGSMIGAGLPEQTRSTQVAKFRPLCV